MKKEQLKQVIKEELQAMLNEMGEDSEECKKLKKRYDAVNPCQKTDNPHRAPSAATGDGR